MYKVIRQAAIGFAGPMALFVAGVAAASFVSHEALWRDDNFWLAFRLYLCISLFIGYCRGFFTYLEVTEREAK